MIEQRELDFILHHLGEERHGYFGAIAPPLIQSSNFAGVDVAAFRQAVSNENSEFVYSKGNNPTVAILRKKLAALENMDDAILVGSGTAAVAMAILSQVSQGAHVICVENPYSWTHTLLVKYLPKFGVETSFVTGDDPAEIERAIRPDTSLLFLESPNTFTFGIQDLKACADIAKRHEITTMIDNSWATPLYQRPGDFGIDISIHSMSKYLNGHSDVVAGAIVGRQDLIDKIFFGEYMILGPAVSPFDAWLMLRSLKTLPGRMQKISQTTMEVVEYLKEHPNVNKVYYPLDPGFPQYELASRQLSSGAGLITFAVNAASRDDMIARVDRMQRFKIAVSWGGPESLVLPIAALYDLEGRDDPAADWNMVRISIGLESAESLIADLGRALD